MRQTANVWWLYQARRVNTQTAGGGGALTTRFSIAAGQVARLVAYRAVGTASAGATLVTQVEDEDGSFLSRLANIPAAASRSVNLPTIGTAANAEGCMTTSEGYLLGPGEYILSTSSAALQNETLTVAVVLLLSTPTEPTWDTTGSGGTPSLAASTISAANTIQAVLM